jgi:hypothetical protein
MIPHILRDYPGEMKPLCLWQDSTAFLSHILQTHGLHDLRLKHDGPEVTFLDAPRISPAEIADMGNVLEKLDSPDGALGFTQATGRTEGWRDNDLTQLADCDGRFRTFPTVSFLTLLANNRNIDSLFFDFHNLDPRPISPDSSRMEKGTVNLAATASGAFRDVEPDHFSVTLSTR